jgi:ABC-2 type transport system ATP-binding protein
MGESVKTEKRTAISVRGLCKSFGDVGALAGLDFDVYSGELFGFLGPNGAGKTTTINILTGLARPDAGTIHVGGIDCTKNPRAAQHLIGVVPDESNLYPELSGFDNLCFSAALYGTGRAERERRARELLESFGLSNAADRKFGGYSRGMKRRLTIAAGIIHEPAILFLDEPTTGIDAGSARQLRQLISELHEQGMTIFLTTHYIEEAERLCQRIAFIVSGRIVLQDTVQNLTGPMRDKYVMLVSCTPGRTDFSEELSAKFPEQDFSIMQQGVIRVEADEPVRVGPLVHFLEERGAEVTEAKKIRPNLEDVFIRVTGIEYDLMKREKEKPGGNR